ncbi:ABC transporter substrate-binding protein [Ectobacillus funiculus]|uniref:ABC transporter substrate-binding protein n=1 Tax=Ectobacillus funiculus TaxID=137993 RepID=UPI00397E8B55
MRKKPFSLLMSSVLASTMILTACSSENEKTSTSKSESASKEKIEVSMVFATGDPAHTEAITDVITAFEKKHPNIDIKENNSGTGSYLELLQTKDAVGEFPDFVEMRDTQLFGEAGKLAEIPSELEELYKEMPTINGKHYVAPLESQSPQGIIYNKKIFKDLGLKEPKNLAEFYELSEKIKKSGVSPIVVGGADIWHMGFWVNKFLIDEVYAENPNWNSQRAKGEVHFSDDNVVQAVTDLKKLWDDGLVDKGWLSTPDNQTVPMLLSGKAAMVYTGTWVFNQIKEADPSFEFGYFPIPDENGKIALTTASPAQGWALSAEAAKDPDKVEAFKTFVKFFVDPKQYKGYLQTANAISATKDKITYDAIEPMTKAIQLANDPKTVDSMMFNQFYGENGIPPQFRNWFYKTIQETLSGQMSVKEAMEKADKEWDVQYKAWKKQ